eukprot:TRINITY_DN531_c0_g1_i2.p2 TRINITY_DN531_c0_g1~~TRINITY_DN531_c0_g1_i2.p2  ORF type:complete len:272 (+),score=62.41 TRINITY_DN531_c0_g1_i2:1081-1896(+)
MIIGPTGSGKSSFINAFLGEMEKIGGKLAVGKNIAYCSQQAWIFNATVQENILFHLPFNKKRYEETVRLCSLVRDLEELSDGDATEIGEKGVNLSGGQKQRINLARAVYANKQIIIMDDPLSALDAHVAREIFENLIMGSLSDKTILLVTNQLNFLTFSDFIIHLKEGKVTKVEENRENMKKKGLVREKEEKEKRKRKKKVVEGRKGGKGKKGKKEDKEDRKEEDKEEEEEDEEEDRKEKGKEKKKKKEPIEDEEEDKDEEEEEEEEKESC